MLIVFERTLTGGLRARQFSLEDLTGTQDQWQTAASGAPVLKQWGLHLLRELARLDGVDLAKVGGATLVRTGKAQFEWLPGLLHAPSVAIGAARTLAGREAR
ncbi:MAG: hypothetical protein AMXMBFR34_48570 [Myxococcaceae bacterium]